MSARLSLARCQRGIHALISPHQPSFLIIGAQKAGTTSLHRILREHRQIQSARKKEIHYFDNDRWYQWRYLYPYALRFPAKNRHNRNQLLFEATPSYLYHPKAAARIHAFNPKIKLIAILREPAARALSAWTMYHHHLRGQQGTHRHDPRPFSECIRDAMDHIKQSNIYNDYRGYLARGLYAHQLDRYFRHFSREQILILDQRQLLQNHDVTIRRILNFLELPPQQLSSCRAHTGQTPPSPTEIAELAPLRDFFRPYNEELFTMLGRDLGWNGKT